MIHHAEFAILWLQLQGHKLIPHFYVPSCRACLASVLRGLIFALLVSAATLIKHTVCRCHVLSDFFIFVICDIFTLLNKSQSRYTVEILMLCFFRKPHCDLVKVHLPLYCFSCPLLFSYSFTFLFQISVHNADNILIQS